MYVAVTGGIAAGATVLAEKICDRYEATPFLEEEPDSSELLSRANPVAGDRWLLASQVNFMVRSVKRHGRLAVDIESCQGSIIVEDRTPFEHHDVYGRVQYEMGRLDSYEFEILCSLNDVLESRWIVPDLLIVRDMDDVQLQERVLSRRGRTEVGVDLDYLKAIRDGFRQLADDWVRSPVLLVPSTVDLLTNDTEEVGTFWRAFDGHRGGSR